MCDLLAQVWADLPAVTRRGFIRGAGGASVAAGIGLAGIPTVSAARAKDNGKQSNTKVVLLGTGGGPVLLSDKRFGISTAVVYNDKVYLIDLGHGAHLRLLQAGLGADGFGATSMAQVRGIFFTHLHSDHVAEWPAVYATGGINMAGRTDSEPVRVFGPADRGSLVRVFPPGRAEPALYNPEAPTPGITQTTKYLRQAFASDFNDRARDANFTSPDVTYQTQDIDISGIWTVDPAGVPPRLTSPIDIWQDGDVRVTATLVDHHPTAPSFAYRFDTPDGSVVISGDTTVSPNLIDLARDCDYLVHEVIDPQFVDQLVATLSPERQAAVREHLLQAHTTIEQVGRDVAEPARAKNLVLTHLVPANNSPKRWHQAQAGYTGNLIVGEDLLHLALSGKRN